MCPEKRGLRSKICWTFGLLLFIAGASLEAQTGSPKLTPQQQENFLLRAKVVNSEELSDGVTQSLRATLSDGTLTHDAHIQRIDITEPTFETADGFELNFRDSYKFNIAAYRLSRMLGLNMIPVSVEREIEGKPGALTWWVDDVLMTEKTRYLKKVQPPDKDKWNQQIYRVWVFDELTYNVDRNLGNLIITKGWKVWMIDHTRAFRRNKKLHNPQRLEKCDRQLLAALRRLDAEECYRRLQPYLTKSEIKALLARRDVIVSFFEQEAAKRGEAEVLFDYQGP